MNTYFLFVTPNSPAHLGAVKEGGCVRFFKLQEKAPDKRAKKVSTIPDKTGIYRFDLKIPVPTESKSREFSNKTSIL